MDEKERQKLENIGAAISNGIGREVFKKEDPNVLSTKRHYKIDSTLNDNKVEVFITIKKTKIKRK